MPKKSCVSSQPLAALAFCISGAAAADAGRKAHCLPQPENASSRRQTGRILNRPRRPIGRRLLLHFHATPKGHVPLDLAGRRLGVGIVPGRIWIVLAVNEQAHITRLALPWACRGCGAGAKILALEAGFREIDVPFHSLSYITFGNYLAVPSRSCHDFQEAHPGGPGSSSPVQYQRFEPRAHAGTSNNLKSYFAAEIDSMCTDFLSASALAEMLTCSP